MDVDFPKPTGSCVYLCLLFWTAQANAILKNVLLLNALSRLTSKKCWVDFDPCWVIIEQDTLLG